MDDFEFNKDLTEETPVKQGFTIVDIESVSGEVNENKENNIGDNATIDEGRFDNMNQIDSDFAEIEDTPVYNPVNYASVEPQKDYKPMSRGLKVFSLVMAAIIALTGACVIGYFVGVSSMEEERTIDLKARPQNTDQLSELQIYEKVNKSIVGIIAYSADGKYGSALSAPAQASGIVYSKDGYIITNDHIYSEIPAAKFKVYDYAGNEYNATFVAGDVVSDLAVLKVDGAEFIPAEFGNSDQALPGEDVVTIGRADGASKQSSITRGIISAVNRRVQTTSSYSSRVIQTDSAINPGDSGGALTNMYAQVIGVISAKLIGEDVDGVGYAIPTTVMKRIVEELIRDHKVVSRAKLGISYKMIDSLTVELNDNYKYVGLLLDEVDEESNLYGMAEKGEVITHFNGIKINDDDVMLDLIEQSKAGDTVSLTIVSKEGKSRSVEVELKANVSQSSYIEKIEDIESNKEEENILEKDPNIPKEEGILPEIGGSSGSPFVE